MYPIIPAGKTKPFHQCQHIFRRRTGIALSPAAALPAFDLFLFQNTGYGQAPFPFFHHRFHRKKDPSIGLYAQAVGYTDQRLFRDLFLIDHLIFSRFRRPFQICCRNTVFPLHPRQRSQRLHQIYGIPAARSITGDFFTQSRFIGQACPPQTVFRYFFHRMSVQPIKENFCAAGTQCFRHLVGTTGGRPDQAKICRDAIFENFMDIGRDISVPAAVITALKVCHSVFQHLQQLIHLNRMQFPDLIDKQNPAMGFTYRTGMGSRDTCLSKSSCTLINGIMHRPQQRVCNIPLIKLQCRCVDLHKFCLFLKGGIFSLFGLLQDQSCRCRFAYPRRAIDQYMLRIRPAEGCP